MTSKALVAAIILVFLARCGNDKTRGEHRLAKASSPYLREHADNPVDWYEWGDEALSKAKRENKPLLISIGYAACHWCHEMEKESFMDTTVARIMNESFVCIKVDREERPDIDNLYVDACRLLNGGEAGWPLNAFALPDGRPFFAGTYYSRDNWVKLLQQVAGNYKNKYQKVLLQANSLTFGIIDNDSLLIQSSTEADPTVVNAYTEAYHSAFRQVDAVYGGVRGRQKFPNASLWDFMLQYHYITGDTSALNVTLNSLTKMALGGIYDQVGGGFARYSVDSLWRVPHFEKMLYDNAQLISVYAHAYQVTKNEFFKSIALETMTFIDRELAAKTGGYFCSINADTKEGEGDYYTWKEDEFVSSIDNRYSDALKKYFNIVPGGNWERKRNILYSDETPSTFAINNSLPAAEFEKAISATRQKLLSERNKRVKPTVDEKIITSWNALLLKSYADAYAAFGIRDCLDKATALARFLEATKVDGAGAVLRSDSKLVNGFLDDYSYLALAYTRMYEVTFDKNWLTLAAKITDHALSVFYDNRSGFFFYSPGNSESLAVRKIELLNNVMPSSNAVMADVLFRLGTLLEKQDYLQKSKTMVTNMAGKTRTLIVSSPDWVRMLGYQYKGSYEVAIMGDKAVDINLEMQRNYLPTCIFMGGREENLPLLEGKLPEKETLVYVCSNKVCKRPAGSAEEAMGQIR